MAFEDQIAANLFNHQAEKSYIDKILAKNEVQRIKELTTKDHLNRSELLELMYMMLSTEAKLINVNSHERNIILKYFVWIREFIQTAELIYDYEEMLKKKEKENKMFLSSRARAILENNKMIIEHIAKFNVDVYMNILRTSLSQKGAAFFEILNNRYEIMYQNQSSLQQLEPPQKKGWFSKLTGGN